MSHSPHSASTEWEAHWDPQPAGQVAGQVNEEVGQASGQETGQLQGDGPGLEEGSGGGVVSAQAEQAAEAESTPAPVEQRDAGLPWGRIVSWVSLLYLCVRLAVWGAPAVRMGISWARSNLEQLQFYCTVLAVVVVLGRGIVGQAQLLRSAVGAVGRSLPIRRRPAKDGDHGRERRAPQAARGLPRATQPTSLPPPNELKSHREQERSTVQSLQPVLQHILEALLENRDAQLKAKDDLGRTLESLKATPRDLDRPPTILLPGMPPIAERHPRPAMTDELQLHYPAADGHSMRPRNLGADFQARDPTYPSRTIPSPIVSRAAHQLDNGKWELGSDFHSAMVKSAPTMVTKLKTNANYEVLKAWASAVDDWVFSHTQVYPDCLGPTAVRSVARMTLQPELYTALEGDGALGGRAGWQAGKETTWDKMMEHLRDRLGCSRVNLKLGLAFLRQENMPMRDFAREFERRARDAEVVDDDAKVQLVGSLNKETLQRLDTYVTTQDVGEVRGQETITDRLRRVSYASMLNFLKQSNLTDMAARGAGGTKLQGLPPRIPPSNNTVQPKPSTYTPPPPPSLPTPPPARTPTRPPTSVIPSLPKIEEGAELGGFAGVFTLSTEQSTGQGKPASKGKGKASGKDRGSGKRSGGYVPVQVPPVEELMKVYAVGLATADQVFPAELCHNPLPALAAVVGVLAASEESANLPASEKAEVSDAIQYLAERVAALTSIVDPTAPTINFNDVVPRGEGGRRKGPTRTMLFDVARGLARRVPLTKLVALDGDVRPYLASLMVAALHRAKDKLVVPSDLKIETVTREQFENMLAKDAGKAYDNYGTISHELLGRDGTPAEAEQMQRDRMERQMVDIQKALKTLTGGSYGGYGFGGPGGADASMATAMLGEYGQRITAGVVDVARRIEDSIPQLAATTSNSGPDDTDATRGDSAAIPGALSIRQVRTASGKLLAAKPVTGPPNPIHQPHIEVAVAPLKGGTRPSKWGDEAARATTQASKGHMMVDTGAAVTLVTKNWAEAHGLRVTPGSKLNIRGAAAQAIDIVGTTQFTLQLSATLEVDVSNVTVSSGEFYQALLGCDLLNGKPGILGPAMIQMAGPGQTGTLQWRQVKAGCIAVADFLGNPPTANTTSPTALPPPPPPAKMPVKETTFRAEGVEMDPASEASLTKLAKERDEQRTNGTTTTEQWRDLFDRAQCLFRDMALPLNLSRLLKGAFAVKYIRSKCTTETALARVLAKAQKQGYEAAVQESEAVGIPAAPPARRS